MYWPLAKLIMCCFPLKVSVLYQVPGTNLFLLSLEMVKPRIYCRYFCFCKFYRKVRKVTAKNRKE